MLNYIWAGLILISIIVSLLTGRTEAITTSAFSGASETVTLSLTLLGVMCLWTGLMNIARQSGLIERMSLFLRPIMRLMFPRLPRGSAAEQAIVMNMTANILGVANAATPLGLTAMKELKKISTAGYHNASDDMCMFVILNTASIQLIPTTILALRQAAGSADSFEIIAPIWLCSFSALLVGIISTKLFRANGTS